MQFALVFTEYEFYVDGRHTDAKRAIVVCFLQCLAFEVIMFLYLVSMGGQMTGIYV